MFFSLILMKLCFVCVCVCVCVFCFIFYVGVGVICCSGLKGRGPKWPRGPRSGHLEGSALIKEQTGQKYWLENQSLSCFLSFYPRHFFTFYQTLNSLFKTTNQGSSDQREMTKKINKNLSSIRSEMEWIFFNYVSKGCFYPSGIQHEYPNQRSSPIGYPAR